MFARPDLQLIQLGFNMLKPVGYTNSRPLYISTEQKILCSNCSGMLINSHRILSQKNKHCKSTRAKSSQREYKEGNFCLGLDELMLKIL